MEKVIRDGEVAVLYSPGFGAGWYTWNNKKDKQVVFHPKIVEMVEAERHDEITEEWIIENLGIGNFYAGGADDLTIEWLPIGTQFRITEYDGSESIEILGNIDFLEA